MASTASNAPLLIIEMGTPPGFVRNQCGSHADWFAQALAPIAARADNTTIKTVRPYAGEAIPSAKSVKAAVITGSWVMVTDLLDWSERTAAWVRDAMQAQLPLLGVCYGHQLMAHALGGTVGDNPNGLEVGVHTITLNQAAASDPLLAGYPHTWQAYLFHQQSVLTPPAGATPLATSEQDQHQILRYAPHAYSTQFHPEFSAGVMQATIDNLVATAPQSAPAAMSVAPETPSSRRLLLDFFSRALASQSAIPARKA